MKDPGDGWAPVTIICLLALTLIVFAFRGCCYCSGFSYSDGERTGVVTKISRKGLFWETWEGAMNLGGMRKKSTENGGSLMVPDIFEFSVSSNEMAEKIRQAARDGRFVTLHYSQRFLRGCALGSTEYDIIGIEDSK